MTESDGEQTARSVALEQAYVHEVYEQCAEKTAQSRHWPRIYKFLEELEPGALVCDIGCGNGKYLSVNNSIFKVGADRCKRLTDIARGKDNEVLICDNLALPFRDESFDAVLSIAVVHHFATTERRVNALKELARVLRIGGKLVISVWAMEQRHRKFESQDVLVPWPKAYCLNSTCNCGTGVPCVNNDIRYNQTTTKSALTSKGSDRQKCRSKSYWIDPIFSPSPSTSSLSSPNETCYSFFRRALQKLAGKRDSANRFLESFHSSNGHQCKGHHQRRQCDSCDDCADVDDIPIELRRLEDDSINITKSNDTLNIKSKSLGDILEIQRLDLVRSRSSIPGLCSTVESQSNLNEKTTSQATSDVYKPRLVKQKTHFNDDSCLEVAENTAIRETINNLPEIRVTQTPMKRTSVVHKQSSMNEELMSMERVIERERVRKNIMKQASLNEEIICKHQTFSNLKDSFSSTAATTRFQLLKSGLTNRIKQSTTSMEKVASISIKNGFVKILQSWTSSDSNPSYEQSEVVSDNAKSKSEKASSVQGLGTPPKREHEIIERRMSKEDGSDSSKDSSLQSDTSVDSEDSFASVIFVPKPEVPPLVDITTSTTTTTCNHKLRTTSAPPSPRVKHPPDLSGPRMKLISISPLLKQFPATSKSLPPPSPPGLSPRTINSVNARPFFGPNYQHNLANSFDKFTSNKSESKGPSGTVLAEQKENNANAEESPVKNTTEPTENSLPLVEKNTVKENDKNLKKKPSLEALRGYKSMTTIVDHEDSSSIEDAVPLLSEIPERSSSESINDSDDSRHSRLNQIKELLKQKPGFATRCTKPTFPLVRRASTATAGRLETVARTLPRLLSLELFNPETDDLDSDSSGVSSPESGDSVISVISDERFILKKTQNDAKPDGTAVEDKVPAVTDTNKSPSVAPVEASQSSRLLEAAANVANSLEDAVGRVIRVKSDSQGSLKDSSMKTLARYPTEERVHSPTDDATWNEECRRHLIDFTEKLSENLIRDIDQYCQKARLEFVDDGEVQETRNIAKKKSTRNSTKYNELVDNTIAWLRDSTGDFPDCNSIGELDVDVAVDEEVASVSRSASDDTMDFVMVSKSGEIVESVESVTNSCLVNSATDKRSTGAKDKSYMRFGGSCESSDNCESIDNTTSLSTESCNTKRLCSASTASLGSCTNADYKLKNTRKYQYGKRSASEEIAGENHTFDVGNGNFSESSSQDSFPSDRGGGSITYHQYYHVFREGELDQLINKYVENLHIISSYYDHANWCIVAEKVQVWTI